MNTKRNGYYDVDVDIETILLDNTMIDELFYFRDLQQRKLFLTEDITQRSVFGIVRNILQYNKEDCLDEIPPEKRKPILLYVMTNGGDVDAGFELIDVIQNSKTPVYTINLGFQYSMGFLIGLAGHKRFATRHAKYLMHDGSQFVYNSSAKARDQMEFQREVEERVRKYVVDRSKLTEDEYDSKLRVEWYLFAPEAKDKGFVDYIIGEDCEIDDVI